jgi:hypothetical protein
MIAITVVIALQALDAIALVRIGRTSVVAAARDAVAVLLVVTVIAVAIVKAGQALDTIAH